MGRRPTLATAGAPYHPVINRVVFETTAGPDATPPEKYAAQLLQRTVDHLNKVDTGAIVGAYLEAWDQALDPDILSDCPGDIVGAEILRLTALVETVLDQARATVRTRMSLDLITTLIPRLKGTRSC